MVSYFEFSHNEKIKFFLRVLGAVLAKTAYYLKVKLSQNEFIHFETSFIMNIHFATVLKFQGFRFSHYE